MVLARAQPLVDGARRVPGRCCWRRWRRRCWRSSSCCCWWRGAAGGCGRSCARRPRCCARCRGRCGGGARVQAHAAGRPRGVRRRADGRAGLAVPGPAGRSPRRCARPSAATGTDPRALGTPVAELRRCETVGAIAARSVRPRRRRAPPRRSVALLAASACSGSRGRRAARLAGAGRELALRLSCSRSSRPRPARCGGPQPCYSSEQAMAADPSTPIRRRPRCDAPEWIAARGVATRAGRMPSSMRTDGGGANPARSNPPLAYLAYAVPYAAAPRVDPFTGCGRCGARRALAARHRRRDVGCSRARSSARARSCNSRRRPSPGLAPMTTFIGAR